MSHITTIKDFLLQDLQSLTKAVKRLSLEAPVIHHEEQDYRLFQSTPVKGIASVKLPNWRYPVVINRKGETFYDNYNGQWGDIKHLNKLKQAYGIEKAKKLAKNQGYTTRELQKQDGSIVLEMTR
ncbi:MAG: hypothetical protein HQL31_01260 [Planctomycetes bacterium]|nr:hypothetical protein [Planctomycetota bacterium]